MLNAVKLYHWKTHSYSTHEATDELYSKLNEHVDEFVEVMLGKIGKRGNILNIPTMKLKQINNNHDLKREIGIYKKFLIDMDHDKSLGLEGNSDLMNIRDEILASMNRFLYLLTLH
jgi:DNA-binding ferritin-like protein